MIKSTFFAVVCYDVCLYASSRFCDLSVCMEICRSATRMCASELVSSG